MTQLTDHRRQQIEMHRSVAEMYRRRAGYRFADEFQRERNELILSLAPDREGARALDLGCGTGLLLGDVAARCPSVVGVDISQEMLDGFDATRVPAGARVALLRGDMTKLPVRDASFDLVLCRSALHHMDDEVGVLREIRRILRPGGRLVLGEPANDFPPFRAARWFVRRRPSFGKIHTIDRAYTRAQLRTLLEQAGLEVHEERRFGFVAYTFCDNPDLVPVLKWLPAPLATRLGRALRAVDRGLARVPGIRNWSWYTVICAEPRVS